MNIKEYRVNCGLKQYELAQLIGVDKGTMSRLENGLKPLSFDLALKIADVLHVSVSDLVCKENLNAGDFALLTELLLQKNGYHLDGSLESEGTILLIGKGNEFEFEAGDLEELDRITNSSIEYFEFEFEKFIKRLKARDE